MQKISVESSSKSRWDVKLKGENNSALTGSGDPQLEIGAGEPSGKPAEAQDLQKSDPGALEYPLLEKVIRVPIPNGHKGRLSVRQWYLLALLDGHQGDREYSSPSMIRLALECRVTERQIKRWIAKLKRLKYIWVDARGKRNHYQVMRTRRLATYVFVDPRWIEVLGLSINQAVTLGYVFLRCNHKPESWFGVSEAARALGLSYATIRRCLAVLAAWDFIEMRLGRKSGGRTNRYKVASFGLMVGSENYPKRARSKCPLLRNTPAAQRSFMANSLGNGFRRAESGLSYDAGLDGETYGLLTSWGVDRRVAKAMAVQWRGYAESIRQALVNTAYRFEADAETLGRYRLSRLTGSRAAYLVGQVNRALAEGHRIRPSRLARAAEAQGRGKVKVIAAGVPTEAELEQLEQYAENVLKPCLAKNPQVGKSAVPAQKKSFCNKSAEVAFLRKCQEGAMQVYSAGKKPANVAEKAGF